VAEFAEAARRLAGLAGVLLGWRPDDFWKATPAEMAAVLAALAGDGDGGAVEPADLDRLMSMFPDEGEAPPPPQRRQGWICDG
jgi:uncharacterized phage protein (TIGR02216 family)